MKRLVLLILVFAMLVLTGCGEKGISHGEVKTNSSAGVKVFEYGSSYITSGLYGYILSEEKSHYLYLSSEYSKYLSGSGFADTSSFWNSIASDGRTFGQILVEHIGSYCKELVIVKELCSKNGVTVKNKSDIEKAETIVNDLINDYKSEEDLNLFLYKYGIKTDDLRTYYNDVFLIDAFKEYLYGDEGTVRISDEEVKKAFFEGYVKYTHIFFKYGAASGETPEQIKERSLKLLEDIKNGSEKFEDHFSESADSTEALVIGRGDTYSEFEAAVFDAETGEYVFSESENGVYIVRKEELTENDIGDYYSKIRSSLADDAYASYLKQYYDSVIINTNEINKYDIATVDTFD